MRTDRVAILLAATVIASACGSGGSGGSDEADSTPPPTTAGPIVVGNQGGDLEGHTPRGFAGSGTGLFVGDNLNPGFPDGDGVQLYLTFDLPAGVVAADRATLRTDAMVLAGTPFADLGDIGVEPVAYQEFGPALFDLAADGDATACNRVGETGLECDVSAAASVALAAGRERLQYRLLFERRGDEDGAQDLALFFLTDSNTNEPGIFTLELDASGEPRG